MRAKSAGKPLNEIVLGKIPLLINQLSHYNHFFIQNYMQLHQDMQVALELFYHSQQIPLRNNLFTKVYSARKRTQALIQRRLAEIKRLKNAQQKAQRDYFLIARQQETNQRIKQLKIKDQQGLKDYRSLRENETQQKKETVKLIRANNKYSRLIDQNIRNLERQKVITQEKKRRHQFKLERQQQLNQTLTSTRNMITSLRAKSQCIKQRRERPADWQDRRELEEMRKVKEKLRGLGEEEKRLVAQSERVAQQKEKFSMQLDEILKFRKHYYSRRR